MFGHDNQDDNENKETVALPPMGSFDQPAGDAPANDDSNAAADNTPAPVVEKPASDHRKSSAKTGAPTDDLLDIKQDALKALTPLVDHLDQTPEERFRTAMMMIQAADNQSLVKIAYEAAQQISNDKERAQALLDIVNEINYFTQQNQ